MIVMGNAWMSGDCRRKRKIERFPFKWSVRMEPHYSTPCGLKRLQDGCVRCRRWRRSGACGCNNLWSRKEPCDEETPNISKLSATVHDFLEQSCTVAESLPYVYYPQSNQGTKLDSFA